MQNQEIYNAEEIENAMQEIETQMPTHYVLMQKPKVVEKIEFSKTIDNKTMALDIIHDNILEINVRTYYDLNKDPWFVGKDVAKILGYGDTDQALRKHVEPDFKRKLGVFKSRRFDGLRNSRNTAETWLISEAGLYELAMSSKLPRAKRFKKWVLSEVLPTIRKTGQYKIDELKEAIKQKDTELVSKRGELQYLSNVIDTKNRFIAIETHNQALALVMVDRNTDMYRFFKGGEDYVKRNMHKCRRDGGEIVCYVDHVPNPLKLYKQIVVNLFNFGIYEHTGSACRMPNVSHKFLRDTIFYLFQQSRYACGL